MGGQGSGRPPKPSRRLLKQILPVEEIFTPEELKMYRDMIDIYLADFDEEDLSSSDFDDIMDLAKNRILEFRLLRGSKDDADKQIDVSPAIEKIRRQNDKLKENLSTRRRDRINPNEFKGFSIVDLAVAFDEEKKRKLKDKLHKNSIEEADLLKSREEYVGNREDVDAKHREEDGEDDLIA